MLRTILGANLKLPPELLDPVAASYDFLKLCDVTLVTYRSCSTDPAATAKFERLISRCKELNYEYRVPIVHGLWFHMESEGKTVEDTGPYYAAFYMTRSKLNTEQRFDDAGAIDRGLKKSALLIEELKVSLSLITRPGSTLRMGNRKRRGDCA